MRCRSDFFLALVATVLTLIGAGSSVHGADEIPSGATYLGCYADRADVVQRALPLLQELSDEMTVPKCLTKCASLGFPYAGLEYRHECYCGAHPPPYEQLQEAQCQAGCGGGGEAKCGGALSLSVWKQSPPRPTFDRERPLVCLVMILKNEAHTVINTLRTVKDHIDCWQILDTGSTDGTPKVIREYFRTNPSTLPELKGQPVPGAIYEDNFVDYGVTRNRILEIAKQKVNPIFTLMLSADEAVRNADDMRAFLHEMRYARGTQHGAYPVLMNTGLKFDSIRIARVDSGWRYKGRVHEYLAPPEGPYVQLYRSKVPFDVQFNATDGPRRFQSQYFIRKILEEDLARDPNDTRSIYYLARTNSGINNHSEAFRYYDLLATRSKWDEEIYHGMVMKAVESKHLNVHWHDRQTMLLDAFAFKPNNMDALHALAQDHFDSGRFQLAYLFALRAVSVPMPPNLSAIENVLLRPTKYLYEYEGQRLLGFAAREIGEWATCVDAFQKVLAVKPDDTIVRGRITLCETELAKKGKYVQPAVHPEPIGAAALLDEEDDNERKPSKLTIPGGAYNPKNRVRARRRGTGMAAADAADATADEAALDEAARLFELQQQQHDARFAEDNIHLDVSRGYLKLALVLVVAAAAGLLLRRLLAPKERKAKD